MTCVDLSVWETGKAVQLTITTYYRVELLPPVVSFITELARGLGATSKELSELAMASEEAGVYIIERYPGDGLKEQFEVRCEVLEDGLRLVFSNLGLPVNLHDLPKYAADQPEETLDGLGLFLIEKMVDQFEFVNHGRAGWRTVLVKRFAHPRHPFTDLETADSAASAKEKLQVMLAEPQHVPGIVELAYRNYGYSYSKEFFYYADQLQEALASGRVRSLVALSPDGRVVGQMAILSSPESAEVAEFGALMVQPEYRRSTGLLQLIKAVIRDVRQTAALALGEANLVTTHTLSQKVCSVFNFRPMALKLSVHGRARFLSLAEDSDDQRESLLHAVTVNRPLPIIRLWVPPRHVAITQRLFDNAELTLEIAESRPSALPETTALTLDTYADSALTILSLSAPGLDYPAVLRKQLFELESDDIKTVLVRFPGWQPLPETLETEARRLRLFFCGWVVEAPDRWWLLYTRLNAQRFDFNRIQLCDEVAVELRSYVEQCFHEAVFDE